MFGSGALLRNIGLPPPVLSTGQTAIHRSRYSTETLPNLPVRPLRRPQDRRDKRSETSPPYAFSAALRRSTLAWDAIDCCFSVVKALQRGPETHVGWM